MGHLGIGAMLSNLGGNSDVAAYLAALNKTVAAIEVREVAPDSYTAARSSPPESALRLSFTDGTAVEFYDDGQKCCEHRYLRTDDNLAAFVGAQFLGAEVKNAPNIADEDGEHEVQFLDVTTSKGVLQVASHNEHNGYYGGIVIRVRTVTQPSA